MRASADRYAKIGAITIPRPSLIFERFLVLRLTLLRRSFCFLCYLCVCRGRARTEHVSFRGLRSPRLSC